MPIRSATPADLPFLIALAQPAPTAGHWSRELYQSALSDPSRIALIAEENSEPLGFLVARVIHNECELENIVVSPAAQRRGLGAQLLNELLALVRARRAESIFLEVRDSNLPARRFYEKHGFAQSGRRPGYYRDPAEDAILYRLPLT